MVLREVYVEGHSMIPTYAPGDRVLLRRRLRRPRVGDVVAIDNPLGVGEILKRVVAVRDGRVELRGDHEAVSVDSRDFGLVRSRSIRWRVVRRDLR